MTLTVEDTQRWYDQQAANKAKAGAMAIEEAQRQPEVNSANQTLASIYRLPVEAIASDPQYYASDLRNRQNAAILAKSPLLANYVSQLENASAVKDEVSGMSWYEKFGKDFSGSFGQTMAHENVSDIADTVDVLAGWTDAGAALAERMRNYAKNDPAGHDQLMLQASDVNWFDGQQVSTFLAQTMGQAAASTLPPLALGAAGFAVGGATAGPPGAIVGSAIGGFAGSYSLNTGQLYRALLDLNIDKPTARWHAAAVGVPISMLDMILPETLIVKYGGMKQAKQAVIKTYAHRVLTNIATNTGIEAGTEGLQQVIQDLDTSVASGQRFLTPDHAIGWLNNAVAGGVGGLMFGAGAEAHAKITEMVAKQKEAPNQIKSLEDLSKAAGNSDLKKVNPEKYHEAVTAVTPNSVVFVSPEPIVSYGQEKGVPPSEVLPIPGLSDNAITAAAQGGYDIPISVADYATYIAQSKHEAVVQNNTRTAIDALTAAEAANMDSGEAVTQARMLADQLDQIASENQTMHEQIQNEFSARLQAAGVAADTARDYAANMASFYRARADQLGQTVEDFRRQYPLPEVRGATPQGMQITAPEAIDLAVQAARKAAKQKPVEPRTAYGPSLLDFLSGLGGIANPGGDIAAVMGGTTRHRGRNIVNPKSKIGLDLAAQRAVEANYMREHPLVQEYKAAQQSGAAAPNIVPAFLEAIQNDKSNPQGEEFAVPKTPLASAQHEELSRYLNELGLTIDSPIAEIKAAVTADQAARAKALKQPPAPIAAPKAGSIEPLGFSGPWQDAVIQAETEDGQVHDVKAGEYVSLLRQRLEAAKQLLDCVHGG